MKHADFVIWMILYPMSHSLASVIEYRFGRGEAYSDDVRGVAAMLAIGVWLSVGWLLY